MVKCFGYKAQFIKSVDVLVLGFSIAALDYEHDTTNFHQVSSNFFSSSVLEAECAMTKSVIFRTKDSFCVKFLVLYSGIFCVLECVRSVSQSLLVFGMSNIKEPRYGLFQIGNLIVLKSASFREGFDVSPIQILFQSLGCD